jgi:hypothetical protein
MIVLLVARTVSVNCSDVFEWQHACNDPQLSDLNWTVEQRDDFDLPHVGDIELPRPDHVQQDRKTQNDTDHLHDSDQP